MKAKLAMGMRLRWHRGLLRAWLLVNLAAGLALPLGAADTQVFTHLQALVQYVSTGDPGLARALDGPKGIATADLDGDGHLDLAISNTDGSVTVCFGLGNAQFEQPPLHLRIGRSEGHSLRGIVCADWNQDGLPDIAVAAPLGPNHATVVLFFNLGERRFSSPPTPLPHSWQGARNLAAGDFDGDGTNDLVVAGPHVGLRQFRGTGAGTFAVATNVLELNINTPPEAFPKPVYSLRTVRPAGAARDALVVTHAETNRVWVLSAEPDGILRVSSSVTNEWRHEAYALTVGPLLGPATSATNDLVLAMRNRGYLEIRAGQSAGMNFTGSRPQTILVPGGPRAVEMVDLNRDGWNDLVVVLRNFDSVVTFANSNGTLRLATERPVGFSPREVVIGDLNGDDYPDAVVINRLSADASILKGYVPPPGFAGAPFAGPATAFPAGAGSLQVVGYTALNHLYLVDGAVAGLTVVDFNGDGRDDVVQLHRASGDFSVRLARADGTLELPAFYTVGHVPGSQVVAQVNDDAIPDLVVANLGTLGLERGSVSVRLGQGDGTFGAERRIPLPDEIEGRLFALVPADFNGDGNIDLAAGFLDSRVALFAGQADGSSRYARIHPFVQHARDLVAGDFDQDGDLDLVGVGVDGELWVVENRDDLLATPTLAALQYPPPGETNFARQVIVADLDRDGDLDLVVGSGQTAYRYDGGSGLTFREPVVIAQTTFPISKAVMADFNNDGTTDLVVAGRTRDTVAFLAGQPDGSYAAPREYAAPSSRFIASGDLDGDGRPDLVGTGKILWTALSSYAPEASSPLVLADPRLRADHPVINEFLARNTGLPVEEDGDRFVDWIELYNGTASSFSMHGWRLRATSWGTAGATEEFAFPPTAYFVSGSHLLVFCTSTNRTWYHTGWKLSGDGGTLSLLDPAGMEVDRVEYPPQQENVSYSRYRDGLPAFVFNPFPSPGQANLVNGRVQPSVRFRGVDPATFAPGQPVRFWVSADDDVGVASVTMRYQRLDEPNSPVQQFHLYDDGLHGDDAVSDGLFAGLLPGGLPDGAEIQSFFEVTDLSDVTTLVPEDPEFDTPGETENAYKLAITPPEPLLELSELVAYNVGCLHDEEGGTPDWVEVRNTSGAIISLDQFVLAKQIGDGSRFYFPPGSVLAPGAHLVVYCDGNPGQGPLHAPFSLDRSGDLVMLTGISSSGARTLIDWARHDELEPDEAWARLGAAGAWYRADPTPRAQNLSVSWLGWVEASGAEPRFTFAFPTANNANYTVEHSASLSAPGWMAVTNFPGNGIEKVISHPVGRTGFFRVRLDTVLFRSCD